MKKNILKDWLSFQTVAALLLGILIVHFAASFVVSNRTMAAEAIIKTELNDQKAELSSIATLAAQNQADAVTNSIIQDCPLRERDRFDSLLGRLDDGLAREALRELDYLFGRCADFLSDRKLIMAARLTREVAVYRNYVELLYAITDSSSDQNSVYPIQSWEELAASEQEQSRLYRELVRLQEKIITTLLEGRTTNSEEIMTILASVREVNSQLAAAGQEANAIRSQLISE